MKLPATDHAVDLVDASGSGCADWTPTQAGTYYLTHEVQTNGVTASTIYGAAFRVAGPELTVVANGELVPGVAVAIEGAGDWPVYYTTDGSAPTQSSPRYEGPFTLDAAAQVRAVAISDGGVRSEAASADFTLHDALSVVGAVARSRYPWNGKVDVDCELKGDSEAMYLVELEAKDLAGGTNLPVRTVEVAAAPSSSQGAGRDGAPAASGSLTLSPGAYRFTWDAAADIADDFDFARVAVTVKATGSHLLAYPKTLELTVAGYTGTEELTNVPTLVRLSTNITGFAYSDFATTNGADLAFFTPEGQSLPYEIDEWNTNGESLVWVKLPVFSNGTRFTCAYGAQSNNRTIEQSNNPYSVWTEYAGVWHMNEDSGTAFDSTEHHLDGIASCGTNKLANVSQMVAYENGACGRARVNATNVVQGGNYMLVPSYDALELGSRFIVSLWIRVDTVGLDTRIISRKVDPDESCGWDVFMYRESIQACGLRGASGYMAEVVDHIPFEMPPMYTWNLLTCVFDGDCVLVYGNGELLVQDVVISATDNGRCLTIGGMRDSMLRTLCGQYDEIRLRGGTLSADRIKADYDMIANPRFLFYGEVKDSAEVVQWKERPPLYMVVDLSGGKDAVRYPVDYLDAEPAGGFTNDVYRTTKLVLRRIDPGAFVMGKEQTNSAHQVTLTRPYYMGVFEMTQKQVELVSGRHLTGSGVYGFGDGFPAYSISYAMIRGAANGGNWPSSSSFDAESIVGWLQSRTGIAFDLPTEAQWEYACRAGSTTLYYWGDTMDDDYAWYAANSDSTTHLVGLKRPNAWGLYDMSGNVAEWVLDWFGDPAYGTDPLGCVSGTSRMLRGGGWRESVEHSTSVVRGSLSPSKGNTGVGLRLSVTIR